MDDTLRSDKPRAGRDGPSARHWNQLYAERDPAEVSWFQPSPAVSLELIAGLGLQPEDPVIDVGAGASTLVDELLTAGHRDVTVLDVSQRALAATRARLAHDNPGRADLVTVVVADLLGWTPTRRYRAWHDRAVFHFLTDPAEQARYRDLAAATVAGYLIVATFAVDGPTHCSGLPVARYSPDELAAALAPAFVPLASRHETHHTPGGAAQPFTWQVLTPAPAPNTAATRPRPDMGIELSSGQDEAASRTVALDAASR